MFSLFVSMHGPIRWETHVVRYLPSMPGRNAQVKRLADPNSDRSAHPDEDQFAKAAIGERFYALGAGRLVARFRVLINSRRRNLRADQSSSMAIWRTVSKPAALSGPQPVSRLKLQVYRLEVPLG